jgi:hypothetical protein
MNLIKSSLLGGKQRPAGNYPSLHRVVSVTPPSLILVDIRQEQSNNY